MPDLGLGHVLGDEQMEPSSRNSAEHARPVEDVAGGVP
jgi:hypothetical protein